MTLNRRWILRRRPSGALAAGDLELIDSKVAEPAPGQVRIRNIFLSLDPTHRIWMSEQDQYMAPVALDAPMRGSVLGVVERSRSDRFSVGDIVTPGLAAWELYTVVDAAQVRRIATGTDIPLTAHMSVLGGAGLTAYFGMTEICRPKAGETVVVTAAAGAVGSVASQIGRLAGARVVGIAGGAAKCAWLTEELKLDAAIDYKAGSLPERLAQLCPAGVDADFENVGGTMLDEIIERMNDFGRVAICGLISTYNDEANAPGPRDFRKVLMRRLAIQGFIVSDYFPRAGPALTQLRTWVREGQIKFKSHIVPGIEQAPTALQRLFTGDHDGKLLIGLSPEP